MEKENSNTEEKEKTEKKEKTNLVKLTSHAREDFIKTKLSEDIDFFSWKEKMIENG